MNINNIIQKAYSKWKDKEYIYEKKDGIYQSITFGEFIQATTRLAKKLLEKGLSGKKIIIYGKNSINYMISDLAVLAYVGITVNINVQTTFYELKEIVKTIGVEAILYDEFTERIVEEMKKENTNIQYLSMEDNIEYKLKNECSFDFIDKDVSCCSKIVFSSGTTSNPKGVMLSLKNIFAGWESLKRRAPLNERDVVYLFLPLHHTYANIYNFQYSLLAGFSIYLCSDIKCLSNEIKEVTPTIFCAVPLIYQKMYYENLENLENAFGNRIKYLFCGGAKFDTDIRMKYKEKGLPMLEAYALTETASSFSIEYLEDQDFESAGTIFEDIDVKIINENEDEIGDIIVKGDNVFLGYVNNERLTKSVFTEDGYFITGDLGYIKGNKLYVTGRKDTVLIGENGENVYPKEIENRLKEICNDIIKAKIYFQNNKLKCNIYLKEDSNVQIAEIIEEYNKQVAKKDMLWDYLEYRGEPLDLKK